MTVLPKPDDPAATATEGDPGARPLPPLRYLSAPSAEEHPYGRGDRPMLIACFAAAAGNVLLAAIVRSPMADPYDLDALWTAAAWVFSAGYVGAWAVGQVLFWTRRRDRLPPFSAFALLCVGSLAIVGPVGNVLYTLRR
jgi:drug/metabolite transporter (DMT)-like permease